MIVLFIYFVLLYLKMYIFKCIICTLYYIKTYFSILFYSFLNPYLFCLFLTLNNHRYLGARTLNIVCYYILRSMG